MSTLLRLAGPVLFFAAVTSLVALLALGVTVLARGRSRATRWATAACVTVLATYGLAIAAGWLLAPRRTLAMGEEVSFCGLDCHLHVAVLDVDGARVQVRLRSDARRAPEYPSHLDVRAVDDRGAVLRPHAGLGIGSASGRPAASGGTTVFAGTRPAHHGAAGHLG